MIHCCRKNHCYLVLVSVLALESVWGEDEALVWGAESA
jgi:hypothetical protein